MQEDHLSHSPGLWDWGQASCLTLGSNQDLLLQIYETFIKANYLGGLGKESHFRSLSIPLINENTRTDFTGAPASHFKDYLLFAEDSGALRSSQTSCRCDPRELRMRGPPLGGDAYQAWGQARTAMHCPAPGCCWAAGPWLVPSPRRGHACASPLHSPGESDQPRKARVHDSDQMLPVKHRCTRYTKRHRTFFRVYSCRIFKQIS